MKNLNEIELFRMTHIENIPHILQYGITHKSSTNMNPNYKSIGDISLIEEREEKEIHVTNGGNNIITTIKLGDFIPFYFGIKMPMLYVVQHGGNFVQQATSSEDIVYIVCNLKDLINLGQEYYFSNGHATSSLTVFYDKNSINKILNILDWQAINAQYWGGDENLDLKRKKQAEFLIKGDLPVGVIKKFICYNQKSEAKLKSLCNSKIAIEINSNAYY